MYFDPKKFATRINYISLSTSYQSFEAAFDMNTSGPDVLLFKNFQSAWPTIKNKKNSSCVEDEFVLNMLVVLDVDIEKYFISCGWKFTKIKN